MKKLIILGLLAIIVLTIGVTPATAAELGSMNQARTKHAVYNEDITIDNVSGQSYIDVTTTNGSITVNGNIDGQSTVKLTAQNGSITIRGNIIGNSKVTLFANGVIVVNGTVAGSATVVRYKASSIKIYGGTQGNATVEPMKTVKPVSTSNN
jgi:hypothetical protein